ncbi:MULTISPECIES: DEAD/DEAH box helicase [Clostridium]|uniref:DEAD/DEAH box helicase n=1 Tax=Clostridium TaxID=1485 RepID=UPI0008269605|nr:MULTISPECIES: DEAD/DEAH box helicase [Clostridium]PJI09009.1 ATP-dependent helicase [Clostridium sp. CT7]
MFNVTEDSIKQWMKPKIYTESLSFYENDNISSIQINESHNEFYNANFVELKGEVEDLNGNVHEALLLFNDKTGINIIKCDCKKSKIDDICSHVGGILIKYVREKGYISDKSKDYFTEKFLDRIKCDLIRRGKSGIPVNMEIRIHYFTEEFNRSYAEIKAGEEKLYVVRDISKFLNSVLLNKNIELGKEFTYNRDKYYIKSEDKETINCLYEIYKNNIIGLVQDNEKMISGKKVYLIGTDIRRIMEAMKDRMFKFSIDGEEDISVSITNKFPPIYIKLEQKNEFLQLILMGDTPISLTYDSKYIYYKENIYRLNEYQMGVFKLLIGEFLRNSNIIKFSAEKSQEVLSYILPILSQLEIRKNVDDKINEKLYNKMLKPEIYIDKFHRGMLINVRYNYDNTNANNEKSIILKDIMLEVEIIRILKEFKFEKLETGYVNINLENIVHFMAYGIVEIQKKGCQVFYSEDFKSYKVYSESSYRGNIRLNDRSELEINFQIEGVDAEKLQNIFNAIDEKKKYYELKEGKFVDLDNKAIKSVRDMFHYLDISPLKAAQTGVVLSKYNSFYVDKYVDEEKLVFFNKNKRLKKAVNSLKNVDDIEIKLPIEFKDVMREYQKKGFRWFKILDHFGFGGILADEMGLGKTLQTIAFICSEKEYRKPSIIVVPTSIVYNWQEEIKKFAPKLKVLIISGSKHERKKLIKNCMDYNVIITSYPLIRIDIEEYSNIEFKYCFLDEAQYIKNKASISARAVKRIKAKNRFALTGTPIENSLSELWSIFDFIMPGYLLSHSKFVKNYEKPIIKDKNSRAAIELNRHIRPFILRRIKKNVVKELPDKIEHEILVDMTKKQKEVYHSYLKNGRNKVYENIKDKGINNSKFIILGLLTRLRQICSNPASFIKNYSGENSKMDVLMDILTDGIANGHRILVFSQFVSVLKIVKDRLNEENISYMYLDGSTKMKERVELADRFNMGDGKVFLISLKAGGTGLNLVGADIVVHFDPWWNPAVEEQASDRAHRIGQKHNVEIIKLIARDTIEENIYNLQKKKKMIANAVVDEVNYTDENILLNLKETEIKKILG